MVGEQKKNKGSRGFPTFWGPQCSCLERRGTLSHSSRFLGSHPLAPVTAPDALDAWVGGNGEEKQGREISPLSKCWETFPTSLPRTRGLLNPPVDSEGHLRVSGCVAFWPRGPGAGCQAHRQLGVISNAHLPHLSAIIDFLVFK